MILFVFQIHIFKKPRKPIKTVEVGEIWAHSIPNYMMFNGSWSKILTMFYSAVLFSQVCVFFDRKNLPKQRYPILQTAYQFWSDSRFLKGCAVNFGNLASI